MCIIPCLWKHYRTRRPKPSTCRAVDNFRCKSCLPQYLTLTLPNIWHAHGIIFGIMEWRSRYRHERQIIEFHQHWMQSGNMLVWYAVSVAVGCLFRLQCVLCGELCTLAKWRGAKSMLLYQYAVPCRFAWQTYETRILLMLLKISVIIPNMMSI